jgi:hypothetical protein
MTWVLYLYDADGVEIGWVQTDPYDFEITHPDGPDVYSGLRYRFRLLEDPDIQAGYTETIETWTVRNQTQENVEVSGKEHLEYVETEVSTLESVASTALVDE